MRIPPSDERLCELAEYQIRKVFLEKIERILTLDSQKEKPTLFQQTMWDELKAKATNPSATLQGMV